MKVNLPQKFSQNDPRWKNATLGTLGTIGAYGCLENDATMVADYYGANETPLTLNDKMKANGGYSGGNLFVWGVFAKLFGLKYSGQFQSSALLTKAHMDQIRSALDKGFPVFLQIDTVPSTSSLDEHWILAVDYEGDDFLIQDPWDGATKRITSWGVAPQKLIYAWCWYEGKVPSATSNDVVMEIKASERDFLVSRSTVAKEIGEFLGVSDPDHAPSEASINVVKGIKSRVTDVEKQLTSANSELANKEDQVARLKGECQESEKLRLDLNKNLNDTLKKLSEIGGVYEGQLKTKQGVIDGLSKEKGDLNNQVAILQLEISKLKEKGSAGLTLWDALLIIKKKVLPFLKTTKL